MLFHGLHFGLEVGQIGFQLRCLLGFGLEAALKVMGAVAAALALAFATTARMTVAFAFTIMTGGMITVTHGISSFSCFWGIGFGSPT
jgi:hypothetical protein